MSNNRSHFVTTFQVRAAYLSEAALVSGEGSIALAMVRSGMPAMSAQIKAEAEMGVKR